mgnify:CR=1 FL=1
MTTTTRELSRAIALQPPTSANEANRSVDLVVATGADPGDGVALVMTPDAASWPDVIPVMLGHNNDISRMAGRITSLRFSGDQLLGTATFTDAPAADEGWALARSGCACSVHAQVLDLRRGIGDGPDQAVRWVLRHVALVPSGLDQAAVTRGVTVWPWPIDTSPAPASSTPIASPSMTVSATTPPADATPEGEVSPTVSRAQAIRERDIIRAVSRAGFPAEFADELLGEGLTVTQAHEKIFARMAAGLSKSTAGHPVGGMTVTRSHPGADLAMVLAARFGVKDAPDELRHVPISRALEPIARASGLDTSYVSNARIIERAFSSSDFGIALLASGERTVLQGYNNAPEGVRALAMRMPLDDFRASTMLRLSKFGSLAKKNEGGNYTSTTWSEEEAAVLQADEFGRIVNLTRKAVINDDLGIFGRLLSEMGASAARLEAELLADVLLTQFTWGSANTATGAGIAGALVSGTLKLRRQTDVEGQRVSFEPRVLLVPPEKEAEALQVLSDRYMPTDSDGVNPFRVTLAVDPQLTATNIVYLGDSSYPCMALGTIGGPATSSEEKFSSGDRSLRVQHDAAAAVLDERSVVKITVT